MSLLIKNGTVVNPAKQQHEVADVLVKDGKIAAIGQNLSADGAEVYDATGLIVAPGLIDIHTHLREPGQEGKRRFPFWYTSGSCWWFYTRRDHGEHNTSSR